MAYIGRMYVLKCGTYEVTGLNHMTMSTAHILQIEFQGTSADLAFLAVEGADMCIFVFLHT